MLASFHCQQKDNVVTIMSGAQTVVDNFVARAMLGGSTDASIIKVLQAVLDITVAQRDGNPDKVADFAQARLAVAMESVGAESAETMGRVADLLDKLVEGASSNTAPATESAAEVRAQLTTRILIPILKKMGYAKVIDTELLPDDRIRKMIAEYITESKGRILVKPTLKMLVSQALDKVGAGGTLPNDMPQALRARVVEGAKYLVLVDPALGAAITKMTPIPEVYHANVPARRFARTLIMRVLTPYICWRLKQAGLDLTLESVNDIGVVDDKSIPLTHQIREKKEPPKRHRSRSHDR